MPDSSSSGSPPVDIESADFALAEALAEELQNVLGVAVAVTSDPRAERRGMSGFSVVTMPAGWEQLPNERWRDIDLERRQVHVGVIGPADAADLASVKAGCVRMDQVKALWGKDGVMRDVDLAGHSWCPPIVQRPLYRQDLLLDSKLFVAVLTLTYRMDEET